MSLLAGPPTNLPMHVPSFQQNMLNAIEQMQKNAIALVACKLRGHKIPAFSLFSHHMRCCWQSYLYNYVVYIYMWRINSEKFEGSEDSSSFSCSWWWEHELRSVLRLSESAEADCCSRVGLFSFLLIRVLQLTKGLWWDFVVFVALGMLVRAAICLYRMILFAGGPSQWLFLSCEKGSRKHARAIL